MATKKKEVVITGAVSAKPWLLPYHANQTVKVDEKLANELIASEMAVTTAEFKARLEAEKKSKTPGKPAKNDCKDLEKELAEANEVNAKLEAEKIELVEKVALLEKELTELKTPKPSGENNPEKPKK